VGNKKKDVSWMPAAIIGLLLICFLIMLNMEV